MNITILDGKTLNPGDNPWTPFESLGKLTVYESTPEQSIVERCQHADIIIVNKTNLTAEIIQKIPHVRCIGVLATGYDNVDIQAAGKQGIPVINVVSYGVNAVAQHAFALLLGICHRIDKHDASVRNGDWSNPNWTYTTYPQRELTGKHFGIVGYGHIGQRVGHIAHTFGMSVLVYNRSPKKEPSYTPFSFVSFEEVCRKSDIISLHCALTPETTKLINKKTIATMKDGAIIINVARGLLLDEEDVAQALLSGKLAGLGADVFSQEPITPDNPLLKAPNTLFTPHIGWASLHARQNIIRILAENLSAWVHGKPQSIVNTAWLPS